MKMRLPNWKQVVCPNCNAAAGANCTFATGSYCLRFFHKERQELAERTFGLYIPSKLTPLRKKTPAMRYWSNACQGGHPELCSGTRKARNGERGVKQCENPAHTANFPVALLQA